MSVHRASRARLRLRGPGALALVNGASAPPVDPTPTDSGTVTFSEAAVLDSTIYQSIGTSKAVPFSLTVSGADGTVEMRTVDATSGAQVTPWAVVGTTVSGVLSGTISVSQTANWCYRQARKTSNPGVVTTSAKQFGVGLLIALIGQSNMVHLFDSTVGYPLADLKTRRFKNGAWAYTGNVDTSGKFPPGTLAFGTGGYAGVSPPYIQGNPNGDGLVYLVNALRAALGVMVGTFEYAVSGSNIASWQPGTGADTLTGAGANWTVFAKALAAAGGDCALAILYQGEENAGSITNAAWEAGALNIRNGLHKVTGRTETTFSLGLVTLGPTTNYGPEGSFGALRAAQLEFVANTPGAFLAGVAGDSSLPPPPATDGVHIIPESQARMGKRYAKSVLAHKSGTDKPGPHISGATISGLAITVAIAGATGALKDGAGGNGSALLGFRVFNANNNPATFSTAIVGGNIVLTLSATQTGPLTLDFGMNNLPFGSITPSAASIPYDSDTVPGDTLGLPLQPCAAITVTGS